VFNEYYHLPYVHPGTINSLYPEPDSTDDVIGEYTTQFGTTSGNPALLEEQQRQQVQSLPVIKTLDEKQRNGTRYTWVYPNMTFAASTDCLWMYHVYPLNGHSTRVVQTICFPSETILLDDFDAVSQAYYKRFDLAIDEDIPALEKQQVGIQSPYAVQVCCAGTLLCAGTKCRKFCLLVCWGNQPVVSSPESSAQQTPGPAVPESLQFQTRGPDIISRAWMGQGYNIRAIILPVTNGLGERRFSCCLQIVTMSILPDGYCQDNIWQRSQKRLMPGLCAFRTGRQVAAFTSTWIAESHGNQCDFICTVKQFPVYAHPLAQSISAGIIKRNPGIVNTDTRSLACDQDAGLGSSLENRICTQW
jgi:hypothetical protein